MSLATTSILFGIALSVLALASWAARREYVPGRPPLVPYGLIQFAALLAALLLAGHLVSLLTGQPFTGRMGW